MPVLRRLALLASLLPVLAACGRDAPRPARRGEPQVSVPDDAGRLAAIWKRWVSGRQESFAGGAIPVWRELDEAALVGLGRPALDYMLAEERSEEYRRTPDVLANVLRILPRMREAADHPRLYPFLLYWLDPAHAPLSTPQSDWVSELRKGIFVVFRAFPREEAVPACFEELRRKERVVDLRVPAISVLLATGHGPGLIPVYPSLPPNEEEPNAPLRLEVLTTLSAMAAPGAPADARAQVALMRPLLRRALESDLEVERFNAMGVLLRLGDRGMEKPLIELFETRKDDPKVAWSALLLLTQDGPNAYARQACRAELDADGDGIGPGIAAGILLRWWPAESAAAVWKAIDAGRVPAMQVLPRLLEVDRARVVAWLRAELRSGEAACVDAALRFVRGEHITELGPELLELVRRVPPEARPPFYRTLVALQTPGTEALLLAEQGSDAAPLLRDAAATELINLGGEEGLDRVAEALAAGDTAVLGALVRRARVGGPLGVPDRLVPAVLTALRTLPGEQDRRTALLVLRYRGRLEGVEEGLKEAYRREPSERLASEIRQALAELATR